MATTLRSSTIQIDLANYGSGNPFTVGAQTRIITATGYGIYGNGSQAWTITNVGTVEADATFGIGVDLLAGGKVSNASASALISGGRYGIYVHGGLGTVTNSGSILATGLQGTAIVEAVGGTVSNLTAGAIIEGGLYGVVLRGAGQVTNAGTILATAASGMGVAFKGTEGGTLTNAGTIIGGNAGMAVQFSIGNDRLTIDPGAVFVGGVDGGDGTNRIVLASAANVGTITGLGVQFTRFQGILVNHGADWTLAGENVLGAGVTLTNEGTLELTGTVSGAGEIIAHGGVETLASGAYLATSRVLVELGAVVDVAGGVSATTDLTATAGTDIAIDADAALALSGVGSTLAGTVSGAGTLDFAGGASMIARGAVLSVSTVAINGPSTVLSLGGTLDYAGTLLDDGGTLALGTANLTLAGTGSVIAGTVTGNGTLAFVGGSDALESGTSLSVGDWTLGNGVSVDVQRIATVDAPVTAARASTFNIGAGATLTETGTGSTFDGTVTGAGILALDGGSATIGSGADFTVAELLIEAGAAVTLTTNLEYAGSVFDYGGTIDLAGVGLDLTGTSILAGNVAGSGTLIIGGYASIEGSLTCAGGFVCQTGGSLNLDGTLTLTGTSALAGAVAGSGILALSGGTTTIEGDASLKIHYLTLSGRDVLNIEESLQYAGNLNLELGSEIAIGAHDTLTLVGSSTSILDGSVTGQGTLSLYDTNAELNAGTNWGPASVILNDSEVILGEDTAFGGMLMATNGEIYLGSNTLTLTGTSQLAGMRLQGAGVTIDGGEALIDSGASGTYLDVSRFVISGNATVDFSDASFDGSLTIGADAKVSANVLSAQGTMTLSGSLDGGDLIFKGDLSVLSGARLSVSSLTLTGALDTNLDYAGIITLNNEALGNHNLTITGVTGSTLYGAVTGTGTLELYGGVDTISGDADLGVTHWSMLDGVVVTMSLSNTNHGDFTYNGTFSLGSGTTLVIKDNKLTLGGAALLSGTLDGGQVNTRGSATLGDLIFDGGASLLASGKTIQKGALSFGQSGSRIINEADGVWSIEGTAGMGTDTATFTNLGTLIKTGGKTVLDLAVVNGGTIEVESGLLDLRSTLSTSGKGGLVDIGHGAELDLAAAVDAKQKIAFVGTSGTLAIESPLAFKASLSGFGKSDKIDLANAAFAYGRGETVAFKENSAKTEGTLTIQDGKSTFSVLLFGQYVAAGFHLASDGHGGSTLTYTPPAQAASVPLVARHA